MVRNVEEQISIISQLKFFPFESHKFSWISGSQFRPPGHIPWETFTSFETLKNYSTNFSSDRAEIITWTLNCR